MKQQNRIVLVLALILVALLILIGVLVKQRAGGQNALDNYTFHSLATPKLLAEDTVTSTPVLQAANKMVQFPKGEKAIVGTITNVKALQKINPTFKNAYNGDTLIIFPNKLLDYDPKVNVMRIVMDAPFVDPKAFSEK